MQRRHFAILVLCAARPARAALTEGDAAAGVREALVRGAQAAVANLGRTDGFLGNARVRIALPPLLERAAPLLRATGQQAKLDELVVAMNRAAEAAVPEARPLLMQAVKRMSVEDALRIVRGGDTSVTEFFAVKTRAPLAEKFLPLVARATRRVALAQKFDALAERAVSFGLVSADQANLPLYVTGKALDGLYLVIGDEEKQIRRDPVGTGSALLRRVFGG